jgi:hypothetical protein
MLLTTSVVSWVVTVTVLFELKSASMLSVIKKDSYPSSDAQVIVSSFQLDASGR